MSSTFTHHVNGASPTDQAVKAIVRHAALRSSFYREIYSGLDIWEVETAPDLARLPIVTPRDLIENGPAFCSEGERIYRVTSTGGTTRHPKTLYRTAEDTRTSTDVMQRLFELAGVRRGNVMLIAQPFDLSHIGYLSLGACQEMGVCAIPVGLGMPQERFVQLAEAFRPNVLFSSPSRMQLLARTYRQGALPAPRRVLVAGERLLESHRQALQETWGCVPADLYGSEETDGLAASCAAGSALHFMADHFVLELVRPGTDDLVPPGERVGEAVVTSLYSRGTPLIRYRLGDLVAVHDEPCSCGRSGPRLRILGRAGDRLELFDGVTLHGYQVESAVRETFGLELPHQVVCRRLSPGVEAVDVRVETEPSEAMAERLEAELWRCSLDLQAVQGMKSLVFSAELGLDVLEQTPRGKTPRVLDRRSHKDSSGL